MQIARTARAQVRSVSANLVERVAGCASRAGAC